ncbi:PhnA domain-containing protein [Oceanihabitans sp. 2_MG-2023]|uniref:PhnA domain-containing protein n=1 Tax=Oceanihabitans sp. 2_MG-2023 TaxID=3062661 RepID=UPI0026E31E64|nr:alkylphosphonate utilization protein [Oceanihabitans sp. 2_MG-2023]MDO6595449.1 PhnA domain-containing protein [Oceanihabitans sp. 2_MG-2023]
MSLERELSKRADGKCELCKNEEHLQLYTLAPKKDQSIKDTLTICKICEGQIENPDTTDPNHWRCLNDSMWSEHQAVQVAAWRMLSRLRKEGWPQDLLDMMYLEEDVLEFAKATGEGEDEEGKLIHRDVNGVILETGDSVVLIKDLKVKGSSMVAKQGTAVRNIRLDRENETYIEGKVGPTQIVIITEYVKKI